MSFSIWKNLWKDCSTIRFGTQSVASRWSHLKSLVEIYSCQVAILRCFWSLSKSVDVWKMLWHKLLWYDPFRVRIHLMQEHLLLLSLLCQLHQQVWNSFHCFSSSVCFTDKSFNTAWIFLGTSLQKIIDTVDNSALSKKGVHQTNIFILFIKLDINDSVVKKLSIRGLFLKMHASIFRQIMG